MVRLRDEQMNFCTSHRPWRRAARPRRRGAVLVLVTLLIAAFFATAAFSIDVARMYLTNAELRASTDAAAKAAVASLGWNQNLTAARDAAIRTAAANLVDGKPLILETQDVVFGRVQLQANGSLAFLPDSSPYGAVRIHSRKLQSSPSGEVPLLFARLLGKDTYETELFATAARLDRDVCLVLDRSGSMKGQKLKDLKSAVGVFISAISDPNQQPFVGLASYSTNATLDQQLTSNMSSIEEKSKAMVADGYTNIGAGINTGRTILAGGHDPQFTEKIMVLMTDGIHNQATSPETAAEQAKLSNIVIHTLTFGNDADQTRMRAIATTTGGTFHHAPDSDALNQAFADIARTIRTVLTQ
jgi:Ca-activated chloride channel family protein